MKFRFKITFLFSEKSEFDFFFDFNVLCRLFFLQEKLAEGKRNLLHVV